MPIPVPLPGSLLPPSPHLPCVEHCVNRPQHVHLRVRFPFLLASLFTVAQITNNCLYFPVPAEDPFQALHAVCGPSPLLSYADTNRLFLGGSLSASFRPKAGSLLQRGCGGVFSLGRRSPPVLHAFTSALSFYPRFRPFSHARFRKGSGRISFPGFADPPLRPRLPARAFGFSDPSITTNPLVSFFLKEDAAQPQSVPG